MTAELFRAAGAISASAGTIHNVKQRSSFTPGVFCLFLPSFSAPSCKEEKEAERRQMQNQPPHLTGAAPLQRERHTYRRSTAALTQGTPHPKGSASGHASGDPTGACGPFVPFRGEPQA